MRCKGNCAHPSISLSVPSSFRMSKLSRRHISSHSCVTLARTSWDKPTKQEKSRAEAQPCAYPQERITQRRCTTSQPRAGSE